MTPDQAAYAHEVADWAEKTQRGKLMYDQNDWLQVSRQVDREHRGRVPIAKMREGACRTRACLAGKVAIDRAPAGTTVNRDTLHFPDGTTGTVADFASQELGLDSDQAAAVFYSNSRNAATRLHYVADHPRADCCEIARAIP